MDEAARFRGQEGHHPGHLVDDRGPAQTHPGEGIVEGGEAPGLRIGQGPHRAVRDHYPRAHAHDGNASGAGLRGEAAGEADDPGLAGVVGGQVGDRGLSSLRGDVHDPAGPRRDHVGQRGPSGEKRPDQVDPHHVLQILVGHLLERSVVGDAPVPGHRARASGVVDEDVDAAPPLGQTVDGGPDLGLVAHVGHHRLGSHAPAAPDRGDRRGGRLRRYVEHGHIGALLGQPGADGRAQAVAPASGDHRPLAVEAQQVGRGLLLAVRGQAVESVASDHVVRNGA